MNGSLLKKALLQGIPVGLIIALALIGVRTLISESSFLENLGSVYGILLLICIPVAYVCFFYNYLKKKTDSALRGRLRAALRETAEPLT